MVENGARVSKMLQVFSKQASLMDTLINSYVSQLTQKSNDEVDNKVYDSQGNSDNGKCFCAQHFLDTLYIKP